LKKTKQKKTYRPYSIHTNGLYFVYYNKRIAVMSPAALKVRAY